MKKLNRGPGPRLMHPPKKKKKKIEKILKMGSWVGFGPIWTADSNST